MSTHHLEETNDTNKISPCWKIKNNQSCPNPKVARDLLLLGQMPQDVARVQKLENEAFMKELMVSKATHDVTFSDLVARYVIAETQVEELQAMCAMLKTVRPSRQGEVENAQLKQKLKENDQETVLLRTQIKKLTQDRIITLENLKKIQASEDKVKLEASAKVQMLESTIKDLKSTTTMLEDEKLKLQQDKIDLQNAAEAEVQKLKVVEEINSSKETEYQNRIAHLEGLIGTFRKREGRFKDEAAKLIAKKTHAEIAPLLIAANSKANKYGFSQGIKSGMFHSAKGTQDVKTINGYDENAESNFKKALKNFQDAQFPFLDQLAESDNLNPGDYEAILSTTKVPAQTSSKATTEEDTSNEETPIGS